MSEPSIIIFESDSLPTQAFRGERGSLRRLQAYLQPCQKSPEEDEYLRVMLREHTLFHLPHSKLSDVLSYFRSREVTEGEVLIQKARATVPHLQSEFG